MEKNFKKIKLDLADPYHKIYGYAKRYAERMAELGHGIGTPLPENETLAVIMSCDDIREIIQNTNFVAAVVGIESNALTVSLLRVDVISDDNGNIVLARIAESHVNGEVNGQEVWPKIPVTDFGKLLPLPKRK